MGEMALVPKKRNRPQKVVKILDPTKYPLQRALERAKNPGEQRLEMPWAIGNKVYKLSSKNYGKIQGDQSKVKTNHKMHACLGKMISADAKQTGQKAAFEVNEKMELSKKIKGVAFLAAKLESKPKEDKKLTKYKYDPKNFKFDGQPPIQLTRDETYAILGLPQKHWDQKITRLFPEPPKESFQQKPQSQHWVWTDPETDETTPIHFRPLIFPPNPNYRPTHPFPTPIKYGFEIEPLESTDNQKGTFTLQEGSLILTKLNLWKNYYNQYLLMFAGQIEQSYDQNTPDIRFEGFKNISHGRFKFYPPGRIFYYKKNYYASKRSYCMNIDRGRFLKLSIMEDNGLFGIGWEDDHFFWVRGKYKESLCEMPFGRKRVVMFVKYDDDFEFRQSKFVGNIRGLKGNLVIDGVLEVQKDSGGEFDFQEFCLIGELDSFSHLKF